MRQYRHFRHILSQMAESDFEYDIKSSLKAQVFPQPVPGGCRPEYCRLTGARLDFFLDASRSIWYK